MTPLTPASTRKNKNKHSQPPSTDERTKQLAAKTNQQQEIWVTSPSPAVESPASERSWERSSSLAHRLRAADPRLASPASGSLGQRSVTVGQRSPSPVIRSPGQRSFRSNNRDDKRVFSRRSSSLSKVGRGTSAAAAEAQQVLVSALLFHLF